MICRPIFPEQKLFEPELVLICRIAREPVFSCDYAQYMRRPFFWCMWLTEFNTVVANSTSLYKYNSHENLHRVDKIYDKKRHYETRFMV